LAYNLSIHDIVGGALKNALSITARSISTSYRDIVTPDMLAAMLRSGQAPERYHPHLMALLDETPLPLVKQAVAEAATSEIPPNKIMKHLSLWAKEFQACRDT
jgi:hypothetical protein